MKEFTNYNINGGHLRSCGGTGHTIRGLDGLIESVAVGNSQAGGGYDIGSTADVFKHIIPLINKDKTLGGALEFLQATLTHWILEENK